MRTVAIIGAGALGGELAAVLARRGRADEVRLIDPAGRIAEGKALDIAQSAPVETFSTRVRAATDPAAAAGADVIALADLVEAGDVSGESGLALVRQIARLESAAPLLFCGGSQVDLMRRTIHELHVPRPRVLGSAPLALESSVRAVTAALIDASPQDLAIGIAGTPPRGFVIGWDAATAFNQSIGRVVPPHHLASISARVAGLWPPGPFALASAAGRVAEALALGTRRRYTCFAAVDVPGTGLGIIAAVPVAIRQGAVGAVLEPALSRHERTLFENSLR